MLVYDNVRKVKSDFDNNNPLHEHHIHLLRELHANISFCILIAVATVTILLLVISVQKMDAIPRYLSLPVYYLAALFVLTLFMVLKRIHVLLSYVSNSTS